MSGGDSLEFFPVRWSSENVNGDDCFRARCYSYFYFFCINVISCGINVREYGARIFKKRAVSRRNEAKGCSYYFVSFADAKRFYNEVKPARAAIYSHGVFDTLVCGDFLFKFRKFWPKT